MAKKGLSIPEQRELVKVRANLQLERVKIAESRARIEQHRAEIARLTPNRKKG